MNNKLKILSGIFGIAILAGVLGLVVWRIQSQKTVITLPKATGGTGQCQPPSQTHLACVNNSCVHVYGVGSNQDGCTTVGATCGGGTIPNCSSLTGPSSLTVGQTGTYAAGYFSPQGNLGGTIDAGQNGTFVWNSANTGISGNSGILSFDWTPTAAGTYDVFCRAWNDAIAECRGKANYVDGPPRYACAGPNSSMTVTVTAAGGCQADTDCPADKKCTNNACVAISCITADVCKTATIVNHACSIANKADGTTCETGGKTCQSGVCTAPLNTANECEVCEGLAGKSCASGLSCKKSGSAGADQGGVCVKSDGSTKCGSCSSDSACTSPLMCVID